MFFWKRSAITQNQPGTFWYTCQGGISKNLHCQGQNDDCRDDGFDEKVDNDDEEEENYDGKLDDN